MEDLDDYLEGELASINEMFEQFQTKDQQTKKRILTEEEELRAMEKRAKEVSRLNCAWIRAVDEASLGTRPSFSSPCEDLLPRLARRMNHIQFRSAHSQCMLNNLRSNNS